MTGATDRDVRRGRAAMLLGDALLLAAALVVTWPWTSGVYTWVAQRSMAGQVSRAPARGASSVPATIAGPEGASPDADAWRRAPSGAALGRLEIERLGLDAVLVKGADDASLRRGPGWVPSTSPPGTGNCGISGHRTTYLAPFRDIDRLVEGDLVRIETTGYRYTYRVTGRLFLERSDSDILFPTTAPTLTLTSCHPPYSDRFRIAVRARLVRTERR